MDSEIIYVNDGPFEGSLLAVPHAASAPSSERSTEEVLSQSAAYWRQEIFHTAPLSQALADSGFALV